MVVKWLRAEVHEGSEAAKRFNREATRMAGRAFDGVIKVEDYGSDEFGRTWMAMEFVDGMAPGGVIGRGDAWGVHRLLAGVGRSLDELLLTVRRHRLLPLANQIEDLTQQGRRLTGLAVAPP